MNQIYHSLFGGVHMRNAVILPPTDNSQSNCLPLTPLKASENVTNQDAGNVQIKKPDGNLSHEDECKVNLNDGDGRNDNVSKHKVKKEISDMKKETCICRKPESPRMIGCDHCEEWYHFECLNLTKKKAKKLARKDWSCPNCVEKLSPESKTEDNNVNLKEDKVSKKKTKQTQKITNKPEARRSKRIKTEVGRLQISHARTISTNLVNEGGPKDEKGENIKRRKIKNTLYNEEGILIGSFKDLCDCMTESCPGCHYECPKCQSTKCGHKCRNNRNWMFKSVMIDGFPEEEKVNPYWDIIYGPTEECNNLESTIVIED